MRAVAALLLASCVPAPSELRRPVDAELAHRLGDHAIDVDAALARPLTADTAVRIALANNPRVAAALDGLGVAAGDLAIALGPLEVDALLRFGSGGEHEIDAIQPLLGAIEAPRRRAAGRAELAAAQADAEALVIRLAARVDIAYRDLLAAEQEVELRSTAFDAADAAAQLRERMHDAGNTTDLAQARDRDAREQARIDLARAEADVEQHRERINALLGLSGPRTTWSTADRVADVPAEAPKLDDLEASAITASLDLAAEHARADAAANRLGVETIRAFVPELGAGVSVLDRDGNVSVGPAIRLGVPLLDLRSGPRAQARAEVARAEAQLGAVAIELRAHARAARIAALAAYDEARHIHDVILPLRQQIVDETLKHYNAMDADPFQLIVARKELVDAGHQYLDALRRYGDAMTEVTALRRGVSVEAP